MRVVHWYPNFLGGGGVANAVLGLATAQAELGDDVTVVAAEARNAPLYEPMDAAGLQLVTFAERRRIERGGLRLRLIGREERARLRTLAPDVVHAHGEFNPDNLWALRLFDAPVFLSPQGAFHPVVLAKSRSLGKRAYLRVAQRLLYSKLAGVHALSPDEARDVSAALGSDVPIYTLPQGGNVRVLTPTATPNADAATRLVSVGRLDVYTKGLDILLDAFAAARADALVELTVVGPDWNGGRGELERRVAALGVEDSVRFTGPLAGSDVGSELARADVYVQLSRHEGLPLAVTEALAAGKPAVLSRAIGTCSLPEVARFDHVLVTDPTPEAACGAIVDAARSLTQLRAAAYANAGSVASLFSWRRIATQHLARYAEAA
jgi:glycosyltransferase involved in cell wall biosynthesis